MYRMTKYFRKLRKSNFSQKQCLQMLLAGCPVPATVPSAAQSFHKNTFTVSSNSQNFVKVLFFHKGLYIYGMSYMVLHTGPW